MPRVDFAKVEDAQDFSPLPDGVYLCKLAGIDDTKTTRAGDEMWDLRFEVIKGEYKGRSIYDRISFGAKALNRVKLLCSRMGIDVTGEVNVTPDTIRGRKVLVTATVTEYVTDKGDTKQKNEVPFAGFAQVEEGTTGASLRDPDDDLPF